MSDVAAESPRDGVEVDSLDNDATARSAAYGLLARLFEQPDEQLYEGLQKGSLGETLEELLATTDLDVSVPEFHTKDDYETLCARFNDCFTVGTIPRDAGEAPGETPAATPAVPLYESEYRDGEWRDVAIDLARAYDHFGVGVDESRRDHPDHLRLELEFVGYLSRLSAVGRDDADRARRDFLDRHLEPFAASLRDQLADEPGTGPYGDLGVLLHRLVSADLADLDDRLDDEDRSDENDRGGRDDA
ncbi:MAG: DMSO reductase family type II enzyme chaperone [Halobacteriales archaeon]